MRLEIRWKWLESRQANRLHWKGSFYQCTVVWLIFIHVKYVHIFVQSIPYKILCMKIFIKTCFQSQHIPLPWGLFSIFCQNNSVYITFGSKPGSWDFILMWFLGRFSKVLIGKGAFLEEQCIFAQNLFRNYPFLAIASPPRCL